jgi:hypothetical protein
MAEAETCFSSRPPHLRHFTGGLSLIFFQMSLAFPAFEFVNRHKVLLNLRCPANQEVI